MATDFISVEPDLLRELLIRAFMDKCTLDPHDILRDDTEIYNETFKVLEKYDDGETEQKFKVSWHGLAKFIEEMGELNTILGKLMAFPDGNHPDGEGDLIVRLVEEMADVQAAYKFFITNFSDEACEAIDTRTRHKLASYQRWQNEEGMAGIVTEVKT